MRSSVPKPQRLYHLWLATALVGTAGLSLTTYSERVLVPQGFAPAGLISGGDNAAGGPVPSVPSPKRLQPPMAGAVAPATGPDATADRAGGRRLIARQEGASSSPQPAAPWDGALADQAGADPATREMRRLLAIGRGPALPLNIANRPQGQQAGLLRSTALPPSTVPGGGHGGAGGSQGDAKGKPTGSPATAPSAEPDTDHKATPPAEPTPAPTGSPSASPSGGPTGEPTAPATLEPTSHPSEHPTAGPTAGPTNGPADVPTQGPATEPAAGPTGAATPGPLAEPTPATTPGFEPDPVPGATAGAVPAPEPLPGDVAAAVPEPSSWLMLLLGLGVLGHALRAGRRSGAGESASEPV